MYHQHHRRRHFHVEFKWYWRKCKWQERSKHIQILKPFIRNIKIWIKVPPPHSHTSIDADKHFIWQPIKEKIFMCNQKKNIVRWALPTRKKWKELNGCNGNIDVGSKMKILFIQFTLCRFHFFFVVPFFSLKVYMTEWK